jgi:hypothetical protein
MALTIAEITRLKDELRKDLEALERVERLMASRNGHHVEPPDHLSPPPQYEPAEPAVHVPPIGLKHLCIQGLKLVHVMGAAPKDVLAYCRQQGYVFSSDASGSASVTTALGRLVESGQVKKADGRYYWVGGG